MGQVHESNPYLSMSLNLSLWGEISGPTIETQDSRPQVQNPHSPNLPHIFNGAEAKLKKKNSFLKEEHPRSSDCATGLQAWISKLKWSKENHLYAMLI